MSSKDLVLTLHIQPNANRNEIVGMHGDALKIRLQSPPIDNRANDALIKFLAEQFSVPTRQVVLLKGQKGRRKMVSVISPQKIPTEIASALSDKQHNKIASQRTVDKRILLASHNLGKLKEFEALFSSTPFKIIPQAHYRVPEIAETGKTFLDNALLKARHAARFSGLPVIADDSGLEVDALGGKPGVYSARFAGKKATPLQHIEKLLQALSSIPEEKRTARFRCVLVFIKNAEDSPIIAEGVWEGRILFKPQGKEGFGYDPIFWVPDEHCTAANLSKEKKNQLSHRGRAMQKLLAQLTKDGLCSN